MYVAKNSNDHHQTTNVRASKKRAKFNPPQKAINGGNQHKEVKGYGAPILFGLKAGTWETMSSF